MRHLVVDRGFEIDVFAVDLARGGAQAGPLRLELVAQSTHEIAMSDQGILRPARVSLRRGAG